MPRSYFLAKARLFTFVSVFVITLIHSFPVWATDEDVTHEVVPLKTQHRWFAWPGYAFVGLTFFVLIIVLFVWYKRILAPKYQSRKTISQ